jgi:hypothetical protein
VILDLAEFESIFVAIKYPGYDPDNYRDLNLQSINAITNPDL